jgi:hypothetical protein
MRPVALREGIDRGQHHVGRRADADVAPGPVRSVEAFDKRVLVGLAGLNEALLDLM